MNGLLQGWLYQLLCRSEVSLPTTQLQGLPITSNTVKWHGEYSSIRNMSGGGPQGCYLGQIEYSSI